jgi:hypothetical protein
LIISEETENDSQGSSWSENSQIAMIDDDGNEVLPDSTQDCTIQRKIEILQIISEHPNWSLKTIQSKGCREYKHASYKKRWEEQIKRGGTTYEKYLQIDSYVYERYSDARKEFKILHAFDLRAWAMQCCQTFIDTGFLFKASGHWLSNFKTRHGITSRRVTKLVNRRHIRSQDEILQSAHNFQEEVKRLSPSFPAEYIINTDQVGVNYELISNRTLSNTGEKFTYGFSRSPTKLATHSHTVQYTISKSGNVVGDVFILLARTVRKTWS